VLAKLEKPEPPKPSDAGGGGPKEVYLICDPRDREAVMPLRKFLKAESSPLAPQLSLVCELSGRVHT